MALIRGKRIGGAFLDLKEVAADGPVLCVFRIKEFHPAEKASGFEGINLPVTADVLICSGSRKGEVHLGEKFIGAITGPLRGVPNPRNGRPALPPETVVGEEIVLRVKVVNAGKSNAGAVGDEPSDPEMAAAEVVHDGGRAWDAAQRPAEPAMASAGNGRPW